jgi:hypothetical protein
MNAAQVAAMPAANAAHALMWLILCKAAMKVSMLAGTSSIDAQNHKPAARDTSEHANATDCRQQNLIHLESPVCSATIIA